jgi:hypothetical protein
MHLKLSDKKLVPENRVIRDALNQFNKKNPLVIKAGIPVLIFALNGLTTLLVSEWTRRKLYMFHVLETPLIVAKYYYQCIDYSWQPKQ